MTDTATLAKEPRRALRLIGIEAATFVGQGAWFDIIYEHAPLGIGLVDGQSRLLAANPALCRMMDCTESDLIQKTVAEVVCPEDQHPSGNTPIDARLGDAVPPSTVRRLTRRGAETVWASVAAIPLPESGGSRVRGLVVVEDVTVQKGADRRCRAAEIALRAERSMLESKNTALREVLEQIDTHKRQLARQLQANVNRVIRPMLQILADKLPEGEGHLVGLLDSTMSDLLDPFVGKLEHHTASLTRRETEVCNMIRNGFSSKQIASVLNTSVCTVHNQRRSIRKKLRIDDGKTNLESFLKSF